MDVKYMESPYDLYSFSLNLKLLSYKKFVTKWAPVWLSQLTI